jgi:hypothetical protein
MKYFIHAVGYGPGRTETEFNTEIEREQPIQSLQDVREIERLLARPYQSRVLVRNWKRFESATAAESISIQMTSEEFVSALREQWKRISARPGRLI